MAAVLALIGLYARRLDPKRRMVVLVLAISGVVWLMAMRNLSAFHDYTAMYYLGLPLAFYVAVTSRLRLPRGAWIAIAIAGLAIFTSRDLMIQGLHEKLGQPYNAYTHDFMRIAAALPGPGQTIDLQDGIPFAPYAFGFYLPDDLLAPPSIADYVISRNPRRLPTNLTPDNEHLFLFRR